MSQNSIRPRVTSPGAMTSGPGEPEARGFYLDRDGDIWEKEESGWRLILQRGVAVDPVSVWDWTEGHVRDYGPFLSVTPAGSCRWTE
ncbi:hypothetical protein [Nocardia mexicana]|uniref:Uncharacterized protein n=1 Tax=Nocardia mexicana TaxID=279262 RepID=A0A370H681_9NOCA|nr:hypothetical protein [Nocardia mexicana]RDI51876.1 hypothetical protein DFR68_104360 [Nocardia mexicana]